MPRKIRMIAATLIASSTLLFATCMLVHPSPAAAPAALSRASVTVEAVTPAAQVWPVQLDASGALAAWQEATISAETGGLRIVALHADVGSRVKRGQVLAELADATVRAEVQKAEAALASARADLSQANANARRGHLMRESGAMSGQQIEQYEIAAQTAAASVKQAEADLANARVKLGQTRIVAVDDGVVSARSATLGTVVSTGAELFRLVRGERVEWRAEVDAEQLARLKTGMSARVTLPGGGKVDGRVRELSPTLDSQTRMAVAYVSLPVQPAVRAGAYVNGTIALGSRMALTLPSSAITLRDGRNYVFEIDVARNTVIQHEVSTGRSADARVEIVGGLKAGTPVVMRGGAFLSDGDSIRIAKEAS